jgi:hypothetical protein
MQLSAFDQTMLSELQIEKLERVDGSHNSSDKVYVGYYLQCDVGTSHNFIVG